MNHRYRRCRNALAFHLLLLQSRPRFEQNLRFEIVEVPPIGFMDPKSIAVSLLLAVRALPAAVLLAGVLPLILVSARVSGVDEPAVDVVE